MRGSFRHFFAKSAAMLFGVIGLHGCAGMYNNTLEFNPSEPLRIAVLPFAQKDQNGRMISTDADLLIDNVALISSKLKQTPAEFMQSLVQTELGRASLDVITPAIVEADLVHAGLTVPGSRPVTLDLEKIHSVDPTELCTKLLSCDAVMYGNVTAWDRSYYGIQAVATVGLSLKLVSAKTKKVLFASESKDSESRGLTKGPTGLTDIVLEPLKGLGNAIITDLARRLVKKALEPLQLTSRPEYLAQPPPVILSSAHDSPNGIIPPKGTLLVVAFGSPGKTGTFSIGNVALDVPMTERKPGHYIGEFVPLSSDSFRQQFVVVSLKDSVGRVSSQRLAKTPVSFR